MSLPASGKDLTKEPTTKEILFHPDPASIKITKTTRDGITRWYVCFPRDEWVSFTRVCFSEKEALAFKESVLKTGATIIIPI